MTVAGALLALLAGPALAQDRGGGRNPVWAVGVGLDIRDRLNLRLAYEEIDIEELDEADALWLNASWKF